MERTAGAAVGQGAGAVRRLTLLVALAGAACASQGVPPGGPPDALPPEVVAVVPDTGAVGRPPKYVEFHFNEVVAERSRSGPSLAALVLVSPRDGEPRVRWKRDRILVRPRRAWRPNTVYVVTLLPGLADLRGNARTEGATALFSTGGAIPDTHLDGIVFDWLGRKPVPRALVQAITIADTSIVYVTVADSAGIFRLDHVPPVRYVVRAVVDANNNRALDPREAWDTTAVTLADSSSLELLAFVHDTVGPRINAVVVRDSVTLRVTFDRPVDTTQTLGTAAFTLRAADSSAVPILEVTAGSRFDSLEIARTQRRADSARRADSTTRGVDSTARRADTPPRPASVAPRLPRAKRDSTPQRVLSVRAPETDAVIRLGAPIVAGVGYRLRAADIRGLLGYARTSERAFTLPLPPVEKVVPATPAPLPPVPPGIRVPSPGAPPDTARPPAARPPR